MIVMHGWQAGQGLHLDRRWTIEELRQAAGQVAWAQAPEWEPWITTDLGGTAVHGAEEPTG